MKKFMLNLKKNNKMRLVEINDYYGDKYAEHSQLMKIVIFTLIPVIILAILNKNPNELSHENCVDDENPLNFAINNTKFESLNAIIDFSKSNDIDQQIDLEISESIFFKF